MIDFVSDFVCQRYKQYPKLAFSIASLFGLVSTSTLFAYLFVADLPQQVSIFVSLQDYASIAGLFSLKIVAALALGRFFPLALLSLMRMLKAIILFRRPRSGSIIERRVRKFTLYFERWLRRKEHYIFLTSSLLLLVVAVVSKEFILATFTLIVFGILFIVFSVRVSSFRLSIAETSSPFGLFTLPSGPSRRRIAEFYVASVVGSILFGTVILSTLSAASATRHSSRILLVDGQTLVAPVFLRLKDGIIVITSMERRGVFPERILEAAFLQNSSFAKVALTVLEED